MHIHYTYIYIIYLQLELSLLFTQQIIHMPYLFVVKVVCELQEPWEEVNPLLNQTQVDINMRVNLAEWMAEVTYIDR